MRITMTLSLACLAIALFGCDSFVASPEETVNEGVVPEKTEEIPPMPTVPSQETSKTGTTEVNSSVNATNETKPSRMSGSLVLQPDLELCQHLLPGFECDKYDLRRCQFQTLVGNNLFFPTNLFCRDGDPTKGEIAANKYCFIQECLNVLEGGVVAEVGGVIAYAEYRYAVIKVGDGIITTYDLLQCGEINKTFSDKNSCLSYYSEWRQLWD